MIVKIVSDLYYFYTSFNIKLKALVINSIMLDKLLKLVTSMEINLSVNCN